ncbi:ROK family transcriptional regulator [Micromonospora narathiwatensis]|uniref:Sugar kinase of the NBD/HSP70 family, may contain an N-terminal HTH domain n=1 Tax=Micromonospora narathiwatensis TaxID=299146 RepID=A0A1A8ZRL2_9ACTN|nr:ROK family transcriptional regulator [Micromonospora narathiwatensis]SBT46522.1 Sugar kinase of the NBD/HSP70 family, may contain an N-terminal HTH domain [Micromonospora narathiwatensis]
MTAATSGPRLRDVNRVAVLALIGRHGPISRADVARRLGLSPPTVTAVTRSLIEAGVIQKVDDGMPRGGRPSELLAVVGPAAHAIGVKVAAGRLTGVRADLDGTVLDTFAAPFDESAVNPFDALSELLAPHVAAPGHPPLLGVGLGVPGFVDSRTGLVEAPLLGWRHMPLRDYLTRLLDAPVLVDNDVNTLAAYEHLYGLGRPYDDFLTITLGQGVGGAVVLGGDLRRGGHGAAGELGHLPIDPDGPTCHCGKRGCLETYVCDAALLAQARDAGAVGPDAGSADLRAAADRGDPGALAVYRAAGERLGAVAAGLATVLDPQAVLVSGEGTLAWDHLADGFLTALRAGMFPPMADGVSVHVDPWDDAKWALGAAALVLRAPFTLNAEAQTDAIRARLAAFPGAEVTQ